MEEADREKGDRGHKHIQSPLFRSPQMSLHHSQGELKSYTIVDTLHTQQSIPKLSLIISYCCPKFHIKDLFELSTALSLKVEVLLKASQPQHLHVTDYKMAAILCHSSHHSGLI